MAKSAKSKGSRKGRKRRGDAYEPVRSARLKGAAAAPPPEVPPPPAPAPTPADDPHLGEGVDEGLRILAALEAMESLEPDFCDDPGGEASVTIIECAEPLAPFALFDEHVEDVRPPPRPIDRDAPREVPPTGVARYAASYGPTEEAEVEIFEGPAFPPALPSSGPVRKARRVTRRFFKALTGDDDG